MSFIHDVIKIEYIKQGYLPDYPYHLISDEEMFDAFIPPGDDYAGYFGYMYPEPPATYYASANELLRKYEELLRSIKYHIAQKKAAPEYVLPDFIYTYMLGAAVGIRSSSYDIHDIITPLGVENADDEYTDVAMEMVYRESKSYLSSVQASSTVEYDGHTVDLRPPTIFGEPHVIKSIRQRQSSGV